MEDITLEKMSDEYFDILKELGNIGAGNATTALAQMMQCKVDMSVPQVRLLEFKEMGEIMGGAEVIMAGIYLGIEGDITGSIMFLLEKQAARHLVNKLMGMEIAGGQYHYGSLSKFAVRADKSGDLPVSARSYGGYGRSDLKCSGDSVWRTG